MINKENKKFYDWIFHKFPYRWELNGESFSFQAIDLWLKDYLQSKILETQKVRILELGCGTGRTLDCIKQKNYELHGLDYSERAIYLAMVRLKDAANFTVGDCSDTLYKSNFFDYIYSLGVHEHIDPINFAECARILNPLGEFILNVPVSEISQGKVWYETCYDNASGDWGKHFEWFLTSDEWITHLKKNFNSVEYLQNGFFSCKNPK